ncbi:hypothetical protein GGI05_003659 [Coemansia sp. RSA 2603]|nr:hypothetical protein GGI05_003659 [Coemansia sp. RSA 2603]
MVGWNAGESGVGEDKRELWQVTCLVGASYGAMHGVDCSRLREGRLGPVCSAGASSGDAIARPRVDHLLDSVGGTGAGASTTAGATTGAAGVATGTAASAEVAAGVTATTGIAAGAAAAAVGRSTAWVVCWSQRAG